ncbi:MAG: bestrophin family protein, partial [Chitinophaga sp.]
MLLRDKLSLIQVFRLTWRLDLMIIVVCSLAYVADTYWLKQHVSIPVTMSAVLGTALAFFIGLNNNKAYDRWWEGRKIWGMLVNDSRSWARNIISYVQLNDISEAEKLAIHGRMITRHIGFLYALKGALRGVDDPTYKNYLSADEVAEVSKHSNIHNAILLLQSRELNELSEKGYIDGYRYLQLDSLLVKLTDSMGMAERIKNTV